MPEAPIPSTLPGEFCVIKYEDREYRLLLDDEDVSSYRLGTDIERIMVAINRYLRIPPKTKEALLEGLDAAREFGAAQVIFHDGTIIRIHGPEKRRDLDWSGFDDNSAPKVLNLPSLA